VPPSAENTQSSIKDTSLTTEVSQNIVLDALLAAQLPTIEVHLSNIHAREEFRSRTMTGEVCTGVIAGVGPIGYHLAMVGMVQILAEIEAQTKEQQA